MLEDLRYLLKYEKIPHPSKRDYILPMLIVSAIIVPFFNVEFGVASLMVIYELISAIFLFVLFSSLFISKFNLDTSITPPKSRLFLMFDIIMWLYYIVPTLVVFILPNYVNYAGMVLKLQMFMLLYIFGIILISKKIDVDTIILNFYITTLLYLLIVCCKIQIIL